MSEGFAAPVFYIACCLSCFWEGSVSESWCGLEMHMKKHVHSFVRRALCCPGARIGSNKLGSFLRSGGLTARLYPPGPPSMGRPESGHAVARPHPPPEVSCSTASGVGRAENSYVSVPPVEEATTVGPVTCKEPARETKGSGSCVIPPNGCGERGGDISGRGEEFAPYRRVPVSTSLSAQLTRSFCFGPRRHRGCGPDRDGG